MTKTKFPTAISLTQPQINWLRQQPNGSELIGKIFDALMAVDKLTPESFHAVQTKIVLDTLRDKLSAAQLKRVALLRDNAWHFKRVQQTDGIHTDSYIESPDNPEPIDDDGQIAKNVLAAIDESIKQLEAEIANVKAELLNNGQAANSPKP